MRRHAEVDVLHARRPLRAQFVGLGVGSGTAAASTSSTTALFGGSGDSPSRRRRTRSRSIPTKGYRDLATAYEAEERHAERDRRAPAVPRAQEEGRRGRGASSAGSSCAGRRSTRRSTSSAQQAAQLARPSQSFLPDRQLGDGARDRTRPTRPLAADCEHGRSLLYQKAHARRVQARRHRLQDGTKLQPTNATCVPGARDRRRRTPATRQGRRRGAARPYREADPNSSTDEADRGS